MELPNSLTRDSDGFINLTGHRIGLASLVHYYNEGLSAEMLACEYPSVSLSLVHKVIAFYLENRVAVDDYVARAKMKSGSNARSAPEAHRHRSFESGWKTCAAPRPLESSCCGARDLARLSD